MRLRDMLAVARPCLTSAAEPRSCSPLIVTTVVLWRIRRLSLGRHAKASVAAGDVDAPGSAARLVLGSGEFEAQGRGPCECVAGDGQLEPA